MLSLADLEPFDYLTLRDGAVARRMIDPNVERFVAEDRARGGALILTLVAYADADPNAYAAAEALVIHVNTAHHRAAGWLVANVLAAVAERERDVIRQSARRRRSPRRRHA